MPPKTYTVNGRLVLVEFDDQGRVVKVTFLTWTNDVGEPTSISFSPAQLVNNVEVWLAALIQALGVPAA